MGMQHVAQDHKSGAQQHTYWALFKTPIYFYIVTDKNYFFN